MSDDNDEWIRGALDDPKRDAERLKTGADIAVYPISGWATGTLPDDAVMLTVEFLTPPPSIGTKVLRFAMMRAQCTELAKVLERLARIPHVLPPHKAS